ncbi:hypothetical protein Pint_04531 [Pistacia integerrima]|uniref:Uncharacterized protein n=1 Tax=Pistacia integerrima TaxID=434235 RepID=A0ACC0Z1Z0_9ROSI|nr:hypothetical protein Pint_04531 [Pistacia integerrima]
MSICSSSGSSCSSTKSWIVHGIAAGAAIAVAIGARAYLGQSMKLRSGVVGIIAARLPSSREHGKDQNWQPHWITWDDRKIAECCREFGADVIMTLESCRNWFELLIEPEIVDGIVKALQAAPDAVFGTAVTSSKPEGEFDPNRVRCEVHNCGCAIYFSRGLIPYTKSGKVNPQFSCMLYLGIQSYDSKFLKIYPRLQLTPLQLGKDLEQLKVIENGYKMKVIKVDHEAHGVDTSEDVEKIESFMRERNLSYLFKGFGADVIMTSESCRNGTERCNEALEKLDKKYDIVVNIQGDEPLIEPEIIDGIVKALQAAPDAVFSTAVTSLKPEDAFDPNQVKCVVDSRGYAIYFSRGLIPYNKSGRVNPQFPYMLHLGIQLQPTPLQLEEDLEQLKVLENGYKMKVW